MSTTHEPILSIGHNSVGRPILLWPAGRNPQTGRDYPEQTYAGRSSCSPFSNRDGSAARRFVDELARYGHAIVTDDRTIRPTAHHVIGCGVGHDDADWCESRFDEGSMAAYHENGSASTGEPYNGRRIAGVDELRKRAR